MTARQLLAVLKTGATVEFPNDYKVAGSPKHRDIYTYENGDYTGLWTLNLEGAENCIKEWKKLTKQQKEEADGRN